MGGGGGGGHGLHRLPGATNALHKPERRCWARGGARPLHPTARTERRAACRRCPANPPPPRGPSHTCAAAGQASTCSAWATNRLAMVGQGRSCYNMQVHQAVINPPAAAHPTRTRGPASRRCCHRLPPCQTPQASAACPAGRPLLRAPRSRRAQSPGQLPSSCRAWRSRGVTDLNKCQAA